MRGLTWQNVEAPRFDLRDFSIASRGITEGFDRFAEMLQQRDLQNRERLTNEALARGLSMTDPEQIAQAIRMGGTTAGTLDPRADQVKVLQGLWGARDQAQASQLRGEQIADVQAEARISPLRAQAAAAAEQGDRETADKLLQQAIADETMSRRAHLVAEAGSAGYNLYDTRVRDTRNFDRGVFESDRTFNLDQQEFNFRRQQAVEAAAEREAERAAKSAPFRYGLAAVDRYKTWDDALRDPEYRSLFSSNAQLAEAEEAFNTRLQAETTPSSALRSDMAQYTSGINDVVNRVRAQATGAEIAAMRTPAMRAHTRLPGGGEQGSGRRGGGANEPSYDETVAALARVYPGFNASARVDQLKAMNFSNAEIVAVAEEAPTAGFLEKINFFPRRNINKDYEEFRALRDSGGYDAVSAIAQEASAGPRKALENFERTLTDVTRRANIRGATKLNDEEREQLEKAANDLSRFDQPRRVDPDSAIPEGAAPADVTPSRSLREEASSILRDSGSTPAAVAPRQRGMDEGYQRIWNSGAAQRQAWNNAARPLVAPARAAAAMQNPAMAALPLPGAIAALGEQALLGLPAYQGRDTIRTPQGMPAPGRSAASPTKGPSGESTVVNGQGQPMGATQRLAETSTTRQPLTPAERIEFEQLEALQEMGQLSPQNIQRLNSLAARLLPAQQ